MSIDKVVVTDRRRLLRKYQNSGLAAIDQRLVALQQADAARGHTTAVVALDEASAMAAVGGTSITQPFAGVAGEDRQYKNAIDAVCGALRPHYLVLLGGPDVIPYQRLSNDTLHPVALAGADPDREIPSDLPYCCDAPYGRDAKAFVAPSRVVGRIPDRVGETNVNVLLETLDGVVNRTDKRTAAEYQQVLAISAAAWQTATTATLNAALGFTPNLELSPSSGPGWTALQFQNLLHYVACHGDDTQPDFEGEDASGQRFPAHQFGFVQQHSVAGTVVVAECCYSAKLRDMSKIALTYLRRGAHGMFGSTNTSFGLPDHTIWASRLCGLFLRRLLEGNSTGLAALKARLDFVQGSSAPMNHVDLKTLAQFVLLGDPSVQPIRRADAESVAPVIAAAVAGARDARRTRRDAMLEQAKVVSETVELPVSEDVPQVLRAELDRRLASQGLALEEVRRFARQRRPVGAPAGLPTSLLVFARTAQASSDQADAILVVDEENGQLGAMRRASPRG